MTFGRPEGPQLKETKCEETYTKTSANATPYGTTPGVVYVGHPETPANPNAEATRSVPRYHHSETAVHTSVKMDQHREAAPYLPSG